MPWIVFAGVVIAGATGIHFFSKMAQNTIDPYYGLVITTLAAFLLSLAFIPLAKTPASEIFEVSKPIVLYAAVGACIAIAHLGIFMMFQAGAPMSLATPLVRMGPVVLAVILGLLFFSESLKMHHYIGLACAALGFILITKG